ncbi:MAG: Ribose ABC transport system, permease protein RbsC, partial [uncultured Craurococcus sp.]
EHERQRRPSPQRRHGLAQGTAPQHRALRHAAGAGGAVQHRQPLLRHARQRGEHRAAGLGDGDHRGGADLRHPLRGDRPQRGERRQCGRHHGGLLHAAGPEREYRQHPAAGRSGHPAGAAGQPRARRGDGLRGDGDRHPQLHHDAGDAADRRGHLRHAGARADRLQRAGADRDAGLRLDRAGALDRGGGGAGAGARPHRAELHALRALRLHGGRQPGGGGVFRRQRQAGARRSPGHLRRLLGHRRDAGRRAFRQRAAERIRQLPARCHLGRRRGRHQPVRRAGRHRQHRGRAAGARRPEQRAGPCADRQLPEDPHPRADPAAGAGDQRLCAAAAGEGL